MQKFIYIVFILMAANHAFAQSSLNLGTSSLKLPESTPASSSTFKLHNEFELNQEQYLSSDLPEFRGDASNHNSSAILRLNDEVNKGVFIAKIKAKDQYSAVENWNYADVHELYAGTKGEHLEFFAGRKIETWAAWDEEWQQGVFNPRYMENRMRMEQAGLAGFFFGANAGKFSAKLAVLPVFIPDFGAHFYVANDRFTSKNPWFHPPTDSFQYRAGMGDIHYSLKTSETSDVIRHGGGALKTEYKDGNYLARLSGSYKPMPNFIKGFPSRGGLKTSASGDHFEIVVNPRVAYDRLISLDNQYTAGLWSFSGSVAYSNPDIAKAPEDWTAQEVRSATIWSGAIERTLEDKGIHAASLRLGFLKVHGDLADDSGPFAGKTTLFERRFQFVEAYSLGLRKEFRSGLSHPIDTEARVIYDRMQGGMMLAFNSGVFLTKALRAEFEADVIGLLTSDAPIKDGFFDEYRANDRVSLGMSYVF